MTKEYPVHNKYGVYGKDWDDFTFNWLGADVSFFLFGEKLTGEVKTVDSGERMITVISNVDNMVLEVTAAF